MLGVILKTSHRGLGGASMNRVVHRRYPIRLQHTTSRTPSSAVPPSAQSGRGIGTLSSLLILNLYFLLNLNSYELKMVEYDLNMLKWQLGKGYRPEKPEKTTAISIKEKMPRIFTGHS